MKGIHYIGRVKRKSVSGFLAWLFHIWCDYELWQIGKKPDFFRILGFEWKVK